MQKKTFRIFFGNNADIQEIEKHLNRGNDERITDNKSNGAVRQKTHHRHHHHRKPRINPIEDANRRVNAKDFNITKGIPHLTRQHILAWVIDNSDDSEMLIQFNCKAHCFGFRNIRLNCYMLKPTEKNPNRCMILELRDLDTRSSISVSTAFFPDEFLDGQDLLEYILVEVFGGMPLWDVTDVVAFLTGEISFYRTRTITGEERNKPIL